MWQVIVSPADRDTVMSRYFFDFHDGVTLIDETGVELQNLDAARSEAIRSLSAIAADSASATHMNELVMVVRDEAGKTVLTASMTFKMEDA